MKKLIPLILIFLALPLFAQASIWSDFKCFLNDNWCEQKLGATILYPSGGGTGTSSAPAEGYLWIGNSKGLLSQVASSTLSGSGLVESDPIWQASSSLYAKLTDLGGGATTTINNVSGPTFTFNTSTAGFSIATSTGTITFGFTEADPVWLADKASYFTGSYISTNYAATNSLASYLTSAYAASNYLATGTAATTYFTIAVANASNTAWLADIGWNGNSGLASSTFVKNSDAATGTWNTAYSWGDHSLAGYLKNNQLITLSGAITGSGTTSILTVFASSTYLQNAYDWSTSTAAKIGTLTNLKWCSSDGSKINCTENAPAGGGVTSLNTLSGALTLWGTSPLTVTASGTAGLLFAYTESDPIWTAAKSGYMTTFATSVFALDTDLANYYTIAQTGANFLGTSTLGVSVMTNFATSVFALDTDLDNYIPYSASSLRNGFLYVDSSGNISTSSSAETDPIWQASSTDYLLTSTADSKYMTTFATSVFALDSDVGVSIMPYYATSVHPLIANALSDYNTSTARTNLGLTDTGLLASSTWVKWTDASTSNWDLAYSWGDHSLAGYLKNNQLITLSGAITGSGTTSILTTFASSSYLTNAVAWSTSSETWHNQVIALKNGFLKINGTGVITTSTVGVADLTSADFGDFTCNGTACSLDASYVLNSATNTFAWRANNLSDLASTNTARTNLGLGTGNSPTLTGLTLSGLSNTILAANGGGVLVATTVVATLSGGSAGLIPYWTSASALGFIPGVASSTLATTGVATLSSLTTIGSSLTNGVLKVGSAGALSTSSNIVKQTFSIAWNDASTTHNISVKKPWAYTITKISCDSVNGTTTFNAMERTEAAPSTGGTGVLSAVLVCGVSGTASSSAFANASIAANAPVSFSASSSMAGTPDTNIYVEYLIDP